MDNVPAEGTPAGDMLAVMVGVAPFLAIVLGASIKPKPLAFVTSVFASGCVVAGGVTYALRMTQGEGTEYAVSIFGSIAAGISLLMSIVVVGGRALLARGTPLSTSPE